MSLATVSSISSVSVKNELFQDLPVLTKSARLNVLELTNSDKQVVNELVYRWCRIITRRRGPTNRVLIIDLIGSINPIRLATILKRDDERMRSIDIVRQCKINSTYITISAHLNKESAQNPPKLAVIYMDEFFIIKVLDLIKKFLNCTGKCQVVLVIPKLDRQARDILALIASNQIMRCDFVVDRKEIGPAPPGMINDSYAKYLNRVYIQRHLVSHNLPDRVEGDLYEDGLHFAVNPLASQKPEATLKLESKVIVKKIKIEH